MADRSLDDMLPFGKAPPLLLLTTVVAGLYAQEYGSMMAGTSLAVVPVVVLFFILQKEFISGLTAGAVKG